MAKGFSWVTKLQKLGVKLEELGVSMPQRFVVGEKLSDAAVHLVQAEHAMWKVVTMHGDGLSDKEREVLTRQMEEVKALRERMHKVQFRVMHSCGSWWE